MDMDENFRTIQKALEMGNDALFEVGRRRLPEELAESVEDARRQLAQAQSALVRLEAELIRTREELKGWSSVEGGVPYTRSSSS